MRDRLVGLPGTCVFSNGRSTIVEFRDRELVRVSYTDIRLDTGANATSLGNPVSIKPAGCYIWTTTWSIEGTFGWSRRPLTHTDLRTGCISCAVSDGIMNTYAIKPTQPVKREGR